MRDLRKPPPAPVPLRSLEERLAIGMRAQFGAEEPLPAEAHPKVQRIVAHWRSLVPAAGLLPGRQHFDPLQVPSLLHNIWLLEIVPEDPRRYRFRLVGGALTDAGANIRRGEFFEGRSTPEEVARTHSLFAGIEASRLADWRRGPSAFGHMEHVRELERVIIPMAADGRTVDLFLCLSVFYYADGHEG